MYFTSRELDECFPCNRLSDRRTSCSREMHFRIHCWRSPKAPRGGIALVTSDLAHRRLKEGSVGVQARVVEYSDGAPSLALRAPPLLAILSSRFFVCTASIVRRLALAAVVPHRTLFLSPIARGLVPDCVCFALFLIRNWSCVGSFWGQSHVAAEESFEAVRVI